MTTFFLSFINLSQYLRIFPKFLYILHKFAEYLKQTKEAIILITYLNFILITSVSILFDLSESKFFIFSFFNLKHLIFI